MLGQRYSAECSPQAAATGRVDRGEGGGGAGAVLELDDHIHDGRSSSFWSCSRGPLDEKGLIGGQRAVGVAYGSSSVVWSRSLPRPTVRPGGIGIRAGLVEERPRHGQGWVARWQLRMRYDSESFTGFFGAANSNDVSSNLVGLTTLIHGH